ncbi:polysaccharide deacetylase family protein [Halorubrum sp. CBA1125]|uniref:polysaccharide deacetylase family protein n=1 Tax=Halorubrum sp. CBA1125 TaxID=2668072 RepID=UPI0012E7C88C|nr:polysaccharide deacetylase family protein [Halorubrum sp. CBA1125]MUW13428.1 polysaccharide deacetylase family protein [Halorubrum sp. CBA1125]
MADSALFSVDLEPNKDGTMDGVRDAMEWFDRVVPRGTVFTTYRIAAEAPDLLATLSESHEIGVHVHPREFGHDSDQLAELPRDRQWELVKRTREEITDVIGNEPISFRAGRHSASLETVDVLQELGFAVDASINVRYDGYLPATLTKRSEPFELNGLLEVPVTHGTLPIFSTCGLRALAERPVTATAATLRADRWKCSGTSALTELAANAEVFSFYMHPYDATNHHGLENTGMEYRERLEVLLNQLTDAVFVAIGDLVEI